tara:strand:- start:3 stop:191 length:189 start_codon:yes stop_codon:yes gene_type:complete
MRTIGLCLAAFVASLVPVNQSFAHMYDTAGAQAVPHDHDHDHSDTTMKDNCFMDPKLGPICK